MSLNITRDKGAIRKYSGGILKIQEVLESGADTSPRSAVVDLGYIEESGWKRDTPIDDVFDETGNAVTQEFGNTTVTFTCTLMQTNKGVLDIPKETFNKFYRLYKYEGEVDGSHQELFMGVGKVSPTMEVKYPSGRIPFEYKASSNSSAITIDSTGVSLLGAHATAPVTIASGDYYTIVETSA